MTLDRRFLFRRGDVADHSNGAHECGASGTFGQMRRWRASAPYARLGVWNYLRQNKLAALVWDSYDEIVEACKDAWNWLITDPERIKSIGARDWAVC